MVASDPLERAVLRFWKRSVLWAGTCEQYLLLRGEQRRAALGQMRVPRGGPTASLGRPQTSSRAAGAAAIRPAPLCRRRHKRRTTATLLFRAGTDAHRVQRI